MRQAAIYYKDLLAGTLTETDEGEYTFLYNIEYSEKYPNQFLTFSMPVSDKPYTDKRLFPFFEGLIPEGWLLDIASKNWKIKQYSILDDGTVAKNNEMVAQDEIRKNQAILKASINGVTAVIAIQTSVANGITEYSAAVSMLEHMFGYDSLTAKAILGTITKKIPNGNPTN